MIIKFSPGLLLNQSLQNIFSDISGEPIYCLKKFRDVESGKRSGSLTLGMALSPQKDQKYNP